MPYGSFRLRFGSFHPGRRTLPSVFPVVCRFFNSFFHRRTGLHLSGQNRRSDGSGSSTEARVQPTVNRYDPSPGRRGIDGQPKDLHRGLATLTVYRPCRCERRHGQNIAAFPDEHVVGFERNAPDRAAIGVLDAQQGVFGGAGRGGRYSMRPTRMTAPRKRSTFLVLEDEIVRLAVGPLQPACAVLPQPRRTSAETTDKERSFLAA